MSNPFEEIEMEKAFDITFDYFEGQMPDKDEVRSLLINDCHIKNSFINEDLIQFVIDRF